MGLKFWALCHVFKAMVFLFTHCIHGKLPQPLALPPLLMVEGAIQMTRTTAVLI